METTPCLVRPYLIPMLCCVVGSTTSIKTQPDFTSPEILLTDFHSDDLDSLSVILIQDIPASVLVGDHDWTFSNRCTNSIVIKYPSSLSIPCLPDSAVDISNHNAAIRMAMTVMDINQAVSNYFL